LGALLGALCDDARAAWPTLDLTEEAFCHYLGARLVFDELTGSEEVPVADLYLACGCTLAVAGAPEQVIRAYRDPVKAAVSRVIGTGDGDGSLLAIWEGLLIPEGDQAPRIGQYKGRGSLLAFLRVAAVRLAMGSVQNTQRLVLDHVEIQRLSDDSENPELQYLKQLYADEFRRSFASALAAMPPAQQLLLRLDVVDQMTIDQAAAVYGRPRTTTGRHLLEARQALSYATLRDLRTRLDLPDSEVASMARLVRSQIDFSVHRLLGAES